MSVKHEFVEQWQAALGNDPMQNWVITWEYVENASHGIGFESVEDDLANIGPFYWMWDLPKGRLLEPSWVNLNEPQLLVYSSWWEIKRHGWFNLRQPLRVRYSVPVWQTYEFARQQNMCSYSASVMGIETDWYNLSYTPADVYDNLTAELDLIVQEALWIRDHDLPSGWIKSPTEYLEKIFQKAYDQRQYANCLIDRWLGRPHHPRSY